MKQSAPVNRIAPYLPLAGLVLLAAGAVSYLVTRRFDTLTNLLFGIGALLLLLFAFFRPDDVRRLAGRRQTRYGVSTLLAILFFAAIAVLIYWIAYQNPDWRFDITQEGIFTPLPETVEVLKQLEDPIHVIAFYSPVSAGRRAQAEDVLQSLRAVSDLLTYEFQDPDSNPLLAEQYDLNFDGTMVFIRNRNQPDEVFSKSNSINDNDIHAALVQVINPTDKKAYFLTGHGELNIAGFDDVGMGIIVGVIEDQGFEIETLNLFTAGEVPEDATVVALLGQQAPLDPAELEALTSYVEGGGSLILARDPVDSETRVGVEEDGLNDWLNDYCGLRLRNDAIIDQDLARAGQAFGLEFIGDSYGTHTIVTQDLRAFGTRFSLARSIAIFSEENITGGAVTPLVFTSGNAWGETRFDLLSAGVAQPDPEDATGPLTIAASCEIDESRIVVFGDSDFITNSVGAFGGNGLLFANAMNWLADDEVSIELTPRTAITRQVNIPQQQLRLLQIISICLGPVVIGAIGLFVAVSRRRRR